MCLYFAARLIKLFKHLVAHSTLGDTFSGFIGLKSSLAVHSMVLILDGCSDYFKNVCKKNKRSLKKK